MLYETPCLDAADQRVLEEIEQHREKLRRLLQDSPVWERQLRRNLTARAIRGSCAIEGFVASIDDVEDIQLGEPPIDASERTATEVAGYQRATAYVQRLADAGPDFRYSKELLNGLHFMIQGHHTGKRPGWWRTCAVYVTGLDDPAAPAYTAPPADQVPALTGELVDWLNAGDLDRPVMVRAAMAHLNLVHIHPWRDGNGRMSRLLQTLLLTRGDLAPEFASIEEWLGRFDNTIRYYDVLGRVGGRSWTPANDAHLWVRFCLDAHRQQAQLVAERARGQREMWSLLADITERRGYPERSRFALVPAVAHQRVRLATYQRDAEIDEQTARRDFRRLTQDGWLDAYGDPRNRYYLAGLAVSKEVGEVVPR